MSVKVKAKDTPGHSIAQASRQSTKKKSPRSTRSAKRAPKKVEELVVSPDLDMEWLRPSARSAAPDEIDALADRVFASVLHRCCWERNKEGQFEHTGGRN